MNDWYCVEMWRIVAALILVFLSGSAAVLFSHARSGSRIVWWGVVLTLALCIAWMMCLLLTTVAGGG